MPNVNRKAQVIEVNYFKVHILVIFRLLFQRASRNTKCDRRYYKVCQVLQKV